MMALADRVLALAADQAAERVTEISLRVGTLAGVDPVALRAAAEVVLAGTCAESARLTIEDIAAACWCDACGAEFPAVNGLGDCPGCGRFSRLLLRGRELTLAAIELEP